MKKEVSFIQKVVKLTEKNFGVICYAYKDGDWWWICINDYDIYSKDELYKKWKENWRKIGKSISVNVTYCYCNPLESKLRELSDNDNLIMNIV